MRLVFPGMAVLGVVIGWGSIPAAAPHLRNYFFTPTAALLIAQQTAPVNPAAPPVPGGASEAAVPPRESAGKKPAFEVATIKLAAPNALQNRMLLASPNRISIPSMTLTWLIYTAYGEGFNTSATVTGGPDWMKQTAYAVEGLAHEPATQRQFQSMPRTLLEERFALKIHTETVDGNIYALVVDRSDGKLGPKGASVGRNLHRRQDAFRGR